MEDSFGNFISIGDLTVDSMLNELVSKDLIN